MGKHFFRGICVPRQFAFFLVSFVGTKIRRTEHSSFQRTFIHQNRVFYIVSSITHDRDNGVFTIRVLIVIDMLQIPGFDNRCLSVIQYHRGFVHSHLIICMIQRTRLFALPTREGISTGRIVLRKNNQIAHCSKQQGFVDFHMCMFSKQIFLRIRFVHCNQCVLRFIRIDIIQDCFLCLEPFQFCRILFFLNTFIQFRQFVHLVCIGVKYLIGTFCIESGHQFIPFEIARFQFLLNAIVYFKREFPGNGVAVENGTTRSSSVGIHPNRVSLDIKTATRINRQQSVSAKQFDVFDGFDWIVQRTRPQSIDKDFGHSRQQSRRTIFHQFHFDFFNQPLNERFSRH